MTTGPSSSLWRPAASSGLARVCRSIHSSRSASPLASVRRCRRARAAAAAAAGAVMEGRREHWAAAAAAIRAAIRAPHNTYRSPFPRDQLEDVLRSLALKGPPPLADSVLAEVVAARPGWAHAHEWRAA